MKKKFDWNRFKTEKIAVHCKTQKEANEFFYEMSLQGIPHTREHDNYWDEYGECTCYTTKCTYYPLYDTIWNYADKNWYEKNNYTILEFSDYFDVNEDDSHYGEINFNGDCFIVKEKYECGNAEWMYLCDLFSLDYDKTERIVIDGVVKYFGTRKWE